MIAASMLALALVAAFGRSAAWRSARDIDTEWLKVMFCQTLPMAQVSINPRPAADADIVSALLGFDIKNPLTIISSQIAVVAAAGEYSRVLSLEDAEPEGDALLDLPPEEVPPPDAVPIEEITIIPVDSAAYVSTDGVYIKNNTTYRVDAAKMINEGLNLDFKTDGPLVLIVHTHGSEAFTPTDKHWYVPSDPDRTEDVDMNIVRVGAEMANVLNEMGVYTLHDKTLHDFPSYSGSYRNSLETVKKYLKEYPSIKIVLDIHRDGMNTADGTKLKVCTTVEDKKTAQVMIVCGTDNSGLEHPAWRENFKLALKMQAKMNEMYPGLARPLSLVKERYNMHTTTGSLLIEIGSNGNTLEEALSGGYYTAKAIGELIGELR